MSNLTVKFIDKEYSIPEDVLLYIDLLKLTDSVKEQLVRDFVREVSKSENGLIGDEDMSASINRQINRFISKLCENNIYNRTATDYLRNNKGKQLISDVNKAALNKMKSLLIREMDEWQSGFESALDKKEASVTGMGFSIWSGSFVNHAIYAAMQASTINKQEQAANKEYQKDMDALRSGLDAKYGSERSYYIKNDYIPNMETALTIFSYDLLDKYVSDLIENGKFDKSALSFVDISRSNELLDNLKLSENKQAILENAFLSCPYNAAVYMATMRYDLLDYDTFQSAKLFKCDNTIISFLEGHWGEVSYPNKFDINYPCIDLLALYTDKNSKDILHDYTKYYANSVVSAYSKIANMCTNEDLCSKAIRELSDNELLSGKNVAIGMAQAKVNSIVPDSIWKQLVNSCCHTDLFDKIKEVAPKNIEINTKSDIDAYFIEQLSIKFKIARQSIVAKINAQKEAEEKRKSIEAQKQAEAAVTRKNKIKKAIIIGAILVVILSITTIVANVIKTSLHYKEQLSIIESSYMDGGYESAVSAIIISDLDESQKASAFNDLINKTKFITMDVYGLKSYVPEHWEVRLSDDGDVANGNSPKGDEDGSGLQWYIQYEGEYEDIYSSGDAYWTDDSDYELTNIDHCTNAYVRYDSGKNNDGDTYMVIDYRVTCDSSVFQIQYFAYEDRYYEKEAQFLLEQIDFSEYKYSAEAIEDKKTAILEEKYSNAIKLMNQQQFLEAVSVFEDISGYKDSDAKITECLTSITENEYSIALELFIGEYIPVGETMEHLKIQAPDHDDYTLIVESDGVVKNVPYMDYEEEKMKIGDGLIVSCEDLSSDFCNYIIKMNDDSKSDVTLSYYIDEETIFLKTDKEETQLFYGDYKRNK